MASGDTKTNQYLDVAANGTRADLPSDTCCETRSQTLIRGVAERIITEEETRAREDAILQDEIDEIRNNPDVADIVATYADLQNYDTSHLTDKDVIRVLSDETHDGASTYYRYDKHNDSWTYIGEAGDYYTKTQTDTLLDSKQDLLTAGENIAIEEESGALVISATDTTYGDFTGTDGTSAGTAGLVPAPATTDAGKFLKADGTWDTAGGDNITELTSADYNWPEGGTADGIALWKLDEGWYQDTSGGRIYRDKYGVDTSYTSGQYPMILISKTSVYTFYLTLDRNNDIRRGVTISSDGSPYSSGSQYRLLDKNDIYSNGITSRVKLGAGGSVSANNSIGISGDCRSAYSSALGLGATVPPSCEGSIALGAYSGGFDSDLNAKGIIHIGSSNTTYGYSNSNYRLLRGLYDAQSGHDAVNLSQLNGRVKQNAGAPTTSTVGTVGQLIEDTTNGKLYICTDATNPYVWEEVGAGGGGSSIIKLTSADYNYPTTGTKTYVALWLLEPGIYTADASVNILWSTGSAPSNNSHYRTWVIGESGSGSGYKMIRGFSSFPVGTDYDTISVNQDSTGAQTGYVYGLTNENVINSLTSTSTNLPLAANQGKVLNEKIEGRVINGGTTAPTTATVGVVGTQYTYVDTTGTPTAHLCVCTEIDTTDPSNPVYTWSTLV